MSTNNLIRILIFVSLSAAALLGVQAASASKSIVSYSLWSPALSIESLPGSSYEVNTAFLDGCPILSRDSLQLYLASNRPGSLLLDIWVAERTSADQGFGTPVNIGAPVNSAFNDFCPSPMRDGQGFMFVSNRDGGCGGADIYLTRYDPVNGWQTPVNLGCEVNSSADEAGPVLVFAEPDPPTLYFSSTRSDELGGSDIYRSEMTGAWSFGPATLIPGVNSDYDDMQPSVRRDGREIVFASNRPGSLGFDIWSASRDSIAADWSTPENLGSNVNSIANETRPSLSWDAKMLLFGTTRSGVEGISDIYYSARE
jgi:Tol biopolymer transport system component